MSKFNLIRFQLGKSKRTLKEIIIHNAVIHATLNALSFITNKTKQVIFNSIDSPELTEIIIQDDELLSYRVEKEVDGAIKNV